MIICKEKKLKKIVIFILFVFTAFVLNTVQSVSAEPVNLAAGEQVFSANCSACHAGGNNIIMPEKTLKKGTLEDNDMNSILAITNQVTNGKGAMPAFGGRLADTDIENVANYVLSQAEKGW